MSVRAIVTICVEIALIFGRRAERYGKRRQRHQGWSVALQNSSTREYPDGEQLNR